MEVLGTIALIVGIIFSIRERRYLMMWRSGPQESPLASALAQLVGTAGGIYLSLELLFSFLKLPEDLWKPSMFFVEPLAVFSLVLAIIQPFALKLWHKVRR